MDQDSLNLRSPHSCDYCENAHYYNLKLFGKNPSLEPEDESEGPRCNKPEELGKPDWRCTRKDGHDGPCAAIPTGLLNRLKWSWRLKRFV